MGPEAVTASGGFSLAGPLTGADASVSGFFYAHETQIGLWVRKLLQLLEGFSLAGPLTGADALVAAFFIFTD